MLRSPVLLTRFQRAQYGVGEKVGRLLCISMLSSNLVVLLTLLLRCCTFDQDQDDPLPDVLYPLPLYTRVATARLAHAHATSDVKNAGHFMGVSER